MNIILGGAIIAAVFYFLGYLMGFRDGRRKNKLEYFKKWYLEGYRHAESDLDGKRTG